MNNNFLRSNLWKVSEKRNKYYYTDTDKFIHAFEKELQNLSPN